MATVADSDMNVPTRELDSVSADAIPDWVFASTEPLVLRGLVKDWPLVSLGLESSADLIAKLQSCYAGGTAPVYFGDGVDTRRLAYNDDLSGLNFSIRSSDLSLVLDELLGSLSGTQLPVRYIASNVIDYYFPKLRQENDLSFENEHFRQNPLEGADPMAGIWIGNQAVSPCHFDAQNNIACCVAGTREFTLFPPSQIENLYPGPLHLNPGGQAITMVDLDAPDFGRYPKFSEAIKHRRKIVLQPGDALFIPVMWWHEVASISPFNVLVNYWWNSFPKSQGQAMSVLEHALLSVRHRSAEERAAWKEIFDYYVFGDTDTAVEHLPSSLRGPLGKLDDDSVRSLRATVLNKINR